MEEFIMSFIIMELFILGGSLALLGKLRYDFSYQMATMKFINLVRSFCVYLIVDICLGCSLYGVLAKTRTSIHLLTSIECILFVVIPYLWFLYAEELLETKHFKSSLIPKIYTLLMLLYSLLVLTSFKTEIIYTLDHDSNIILGIYAPIIIRTLLIIFFGTTTIYGIINIVTAKSKVLIKKSLRVIGFVLPIIVTLIIYYRYNIADYVPLAVFMAILQCFLTLEDPMSYKDELTGLYNRKRLTALYDERKISYLKDGLNSVYYIDANDFKGINDTYGHLEGDKVLKILGKAFKNIDNQYNSVSFRMGGDEFVIVACLENLKEMDFKQVIRDEIKRVELAEGCEHCIRTSIGQAILYGDDDDSLEICLRIADEDMYQDKCNIKQAR